VAGHGHFRGLAATVGNSRKTTVWPRVASDCGESVDRESDSVKSTAIDDQEKSAGGLSSLGCRSVLPAKVPFGECPTGSRLQIPLEA
jgi:hypothetical protein